jgi:hypothetical protein
MTPDSDVYQEPTAKSAQDRHDGGVVWGALRRDTDALDDALDVATSALYSASIAAQWRTDKGYPIASALSDILGGLSTFLDGLLTQRVELANNRSGTDSE